MQEMYSPFQYVPTGWVGIMFLVLFGITTATHLFEAIYFRTMYMIPTLVLCGVGELLGWGGRYWGHVDPLSRDAFMMQISTTIISPSFMTAAMFLILPKIINELGVEFSRMPPRLYLIIFITVDVTALVIQAIGGGMASVAETFEAAEQGAHIMLGGIIIQLAAVVLYTILGLEFIIRFTYDRPARLNATTGPRKYAGWTEVSRSIVWMLVGLVIGTLLIIMRSIYRTIELNDGWGGGIIAIEKWFNWFDGAPIVVAMFTFNLLHPGYLLGNVQSNELPVSQSSTIDPKDMSQV
ncbi:RTA1 like protein-domain-containing protein [Rhizoctonia solani]|nr:RTA1 like protein-domain-containing protein [Rhizoctonia solani]